MDPMIPMNVKAAMQRIRGGLLLLAILLCCTSCLYSRLLSFKEQLAEFDQNVRVINGGRTLQFLNPIVEAGDLTKLTGFSPSQSEWAAPGELIHTYRYRSLSPLAATETAHVLSFTLRFTPNALAAFDYPELVADVLGTNLIVAAARAIGQSKLMQREHRLEWALGTNQTSSLIPSRDAITKVLGPPETADPTIPDAPVSYRFLLEESNGALQPKIGLSAQFQFDPTTDLLRHGSILVGKLKLVVDFPPPQP